MTDSNPSSETNPPDFDLPTPRGQRNWLLKPRYTHAEIAEAATQAGFPLSRVAVSFIERQALLKITRNLSNPRLRHIAQHIEDLGYGILVKKTQATPLTPLPISDPPITPTSRTHRLLLLSRFSGLPPLRLASLERTHDPPKTHCTPLLRRHPIQRHVASLLSVDSPTLN